MPIINEVSRKNLIGKTKVHSPARYNRRLKYSVMSIPEVDEDKLLKEDSLVINVRVGQYVVTISYDGVIQHMLDIIKQDARHKLNRRVVVRAMNEQIDLTDVYVRCQCGDFKYRFAFMATRHRYIYGTPENRPSNITNPDDSLGAVCKHIACVLSNKQWLVKAASVVNDILHDNYEMFLSNYNISEEDAVIDMQRYSTAISRELKKQIKKPPVELLGAASKLYDPDDLEYSLFQLLDRKGWLVRVDFDLDKPVMVYISKSSDALDNPEETEEIIYKYEIKPAGTKVRLQQVKE